MNGNSIYLAYEDLRSYESNLLPGVTSPRISRRPPASRRRRKPSS